MLTEKDYCDYETCVALKELGYPTKMTFVSEFGSIEIPINSGLIQLYESQKWLREEKFLLIVVDRLLNGEYVFSVVDILNYSEEKMVQLIPTKKPLPKASRRLLKFWRRSN